MLHVVLESKEIDPTLCKVMNAVATAGHEAADFLRLVLARCRWSYEHSPALQPALAALAAARADDPGSYAWWSNRVMSGEV